MKTLNAKRITTIAAGAALLGIGVALAGGITFQNVPIISSTGQPVVQVVVGSQAKPIDAVSAGNIAAAIGNLAYASVPVTATVNATQAKSVLKVQVTSASTSISNAQVYLNESGVVGASSGSYTFGALIGSVLNGAIILSSPQNTKGYQGSGQYTYPASFGNSQPSIIISPPASPYATVGTVPAVTTPSSSTAGGVSGFSGTTFVGTGGYDNIMQITNAQLSPLLSTYGANGESSYIWLTGFPVYDQQTSVASFQLMSAGGAYQVTFSKPIQALTSTGSRQINQPILLLGQNWTIINETPPTTQVISSSNVVSGGKLRLAASLAPLTTVYVLHNITSGPFTVELADLGQPNSNGISPASVDVYYNNVLSNVSSIYPGVTQRFNVSGSNLYVYVNQTFAGLYAYQKWAKMQLYSNVYNLTNGKVFNQTNDPGWIVQLLWTNTTSAGQANANALQSIIIYNQTPATLTPGQGFTFIQNPQKFKVTFVGDTFGSANFDQITAAVQPTSQLNYQNQGTLQALHSPNVNNVTEPAAELVVSSQIPSAFSYSGQTGSSVTYDLTSYALNENANQVDALAAMGNKGYFATNVIFSYTNVNAANWITMTNQVTLLISGWQQTSPGTFQYITSNPTITTASNTQILTGNFYNVTGIQIVNNRGLPGALSVAVKTVDTTGNAFALATLVNTAPQVIWSPASGKPWYQSSLTAAGNVIYNQQNGQPTTVFTLTGVTANAVTPIGQYGYYVMNEIAVPTNTVATDTLSFGIDNSTAGVTAGTLFNINYTQSVVSGVNTGAGTHNNATYVSTYGTMVNAPPGFRTERGSKVASIGSTSDTFWIARSVDFLQLAVGTTNSVVSSKSYHLYGPYAVGQATNIANVSIGPVSGNVVLGAGSVYNITGIGNIQAIPSVSSASTPVLLTSLSSTAPLVVLDSQANTGSTLILVGSGFVNSLSQQLQSAYNITITPSSAPITAAYGANRILVAGFTGNQTWSAAQTFINQLYAQATT